MIADFVQRRRYIDRFHGRVCDFVCSSMFSERLVAPGRRSGCHGDRRRPRCRSGPKQLAASQSVPVPVPVPCSVQLWRLWSVLRPKVTPLNASNLYALRESNISKIVRGTSHTWSPVIPVTTRIQISSEYYYILYAVQNIAKTEL